MQSIMVFGCDYIYNKLKTEYAKYVISDVPSGTKRSSSNCLYLTLENWDYVLLLQVVLHEGKSCRVYNAETFNITLAVGA